jgi:hypothetical protein
MSENKTIIIPCSGIGKSYGSVSREAAYIVTKALRPDETHIIPLALLVMGDEAARQQVSQCPVITIDGCKLACATKMVQESDAAVPPSQPRQQFAVLDTYRRNREFKPQGIAELNEGGLKLAEALAKEISEALHA